MQVVNTSLVTIVDEFLDWVSRSRSAATYEWYRCRLQSFIDCYPDLSIDQLNYYRLQTLVVELDDGPKNSGNRTPFLKRMIEFADWSGLHLGVDRIGGDYPTGAIVPKAEMQGLNKRLEQRASLPKL